MPEDEDTITHQAKSLVVAVIKITPAPIILVIVSFVMSMTLMYSFIDSLGCNAFTGSNELSQLFRFKDTCDIGTLTLNGATLFFGSLLISICVTLVFVFLMTKMIFVKNDDALSDIRRELKGEWQIISTSSDGAEWRGTAHYDIDRLHKLVLTMTLPARGPYAQYHLSTYDISLNPRTDPIKITYFIDDRFPISTGGSIDRLLVVILRWVYNPGDGLEHLDGVWYDLNPPASSMRNSGPITFTRKRRK
jgi:hypothetical protein